MLSKIPYRPRVVDAELARLLRAEGAVVIEGPKACGKTETARQVAESEVRLDVDEAIRRAAAVNPAILLEGRRPRLIDEWQLEPNVWNHVRRAADDEGKGQFILTGSAVPPDDETRHTGAGRIARLRMRPMSLFESGISSGEISLHAVFAGDPAASPDAGITLDVVCDAICRGGWPALQSADLPDALRNLRDYLNGVSRTDIRRVDGVRRNPAKVSQLLRSLARNVATHAAATTLAADVSGNAVTDDSVVDYLKALERLMVVEDQPAWGPHLRSRYNVRNSPKRHYVDPSLAVAAVRGTPTELLKDLNYLGFLFESLVVRDLRIYGQALDASVLQYRDNSGLEIDAVVKSESGPWGAFEIKLGGRLIDEGANNLLRFAKRVDTKRCGDPAVLAVVVATGPGYVREDGVAVIPITALRP